MLGDLQQPLDHLLTFHAFGLLQTQFAICENGVMTRLLEKPVLIRTLPVLETLF